MFKKIIKKLKFGSCKTAKIDDVDSFKEHQKKDENSVKWNTVVKSAISNGKEHHTLLTKFVIMKKHMLPM